MRSLVYLTLHRFLNSMKRLPKNPRLLVPVIFFAAIFFSQLFPLFVLHQKYPTSASLHRQAERRHVTHMAHSAGFDPSTFVATIKGFLIVSLLTAIVTALGDGNLFFEPSDVDFLFPAPISRRSVLFLRMAPRYLILVLIATYFPIVFGPLLLLSDPDLNLLSLWPGVLGAWLFLLTGTNLAQAGILFRWARDGGAATPEQRRRVTSLGFVLLALCGVAVYMFMRQSTGSGGLGGFRLKDALPLLNSHLFSLALAPISWAADLFRVAFEGWNSVAVWRLGGLLVLAGASFVLLYFRDSDFYEGATEVSARRGRLVAAARRGDSSALLSQMAEDGSLRGGAARGLRTFGGGAWGVLWRDLIAVSRMPLRSWTPLILIAIFPAFFGQVIGHRSDVGVLAWMVMFCLQMSGVFLVAARTMLRRADITKALPIDPVRLLLAEQATSIAQLTLLGWLSLTIMVLFGNGHGPLLIVAYLVFPTLTTLIIFVQTSFVLLYPQQNDVAQNLVGNILGLIVSILALLPCVSVGLVMYFMLHSPSWLIGIAAAGVNMAAAACAVLLAAFLWQRFDPTG